MPEHDPHDFNAFFPTESSSSKPKETRALPLWEEIDETFKDIFAFDEERRNEAIFRYNLLDTLVDLNGPELTIKKIEQSHEYLKDKFGSHVRSLVLFLNIGLRLNSLNINYRHWYLK